VVSLSGLFLRNWTLKVSAFGVALILWVAARAEVPNRHEMPGIPVQIDLGDPGWEIVGGPSPSAVTVRFGGPSRELLRMAIDRPNLVIPLDQVTSEDTVVVLRTAWVRVQDWPGVIAEDVQPPSVRVMLEPVEHVDRPPAVRMQGELPDHLALPAIPVVAPATIRVTGARSRIAALDSIPLLPLDLSEVSASGTVLLGVDVTGLDRLQFQPSEVQVELRVEDRVERVVSGIPVVLPEAFRGDASLQILPATGSVIIRGARSVVERADPTAFALVAGFEDREPPAAGEAGEFSLTLIGLPPLLEGETLFPTVTVQRRAGSPQ
jgi:YbbR domain-containing protein